VVAMRNKLMRDQKEKRKKQSYPLHTSKLEAITVASKF
jgi:hypothetical protein